MSFADNALQDRLTGALIGMAHARDGNEDLAAQQTDAIMLEGLCASSDPAACSDPDVYSLIGQICAEKFRFAPDCAVCKHPCGKNADYDMDLLWRAEPRIRVFKYMILMGLRGMAEPARAAAQEGRLSAEVLNFLYQMLCVLGEDWPLEGLAPIVKDVGKMHLKLRAQSDSRADHGLLVIRPDGTRCVLADAEFQTALANDIYSGRISRIVLAPCPDGADEARLIERLAPGSALVPLPIERIASAGSILSAVRDLAAPAGNFADETGNFSLAAALCRYEPAPIAAMLTLISLGCRDILLAPDFPQAMPSNMPAILSENLAVTAATW